MNKNEMRKKHHEVVRRNQDGDNKRKRVLKNRSLRERFIAPKREIYLTHEIERQKEANELKKSESATQNNIENNA